MPRITWSELSFRSRRWGKELLISFWRPWGGPDFPCQGLKFGRVPSFRLDHKFSSIFRRGGGGGDGQELSPLTKKERSFLLVDKEVNRAFFFLEKSDGPFFWVAGVEDLSVYQEVKEPSSFSWYWKEFSSCLLWWSRELIRCYWRLGRGALWFLARSEVSSVSSCLRGD